MPSHLGSAGRSRRLVAAFAVLVLLAWTFAAALPHRHDPAGASGAAGTAATSRGAALAPAAAVHAAAATGCALCGWLAAPLLPVARLRLCSAPPLRAFPALSLPLLLSFAAAVPLRRRPRAPPDA